MSIYQGNWGPAKLTVLLPLLSQLRNLCMVLLSQKQVCRVTFAPPFLWDMCASNYVGINSLQVSCIDPEEQK